MLLLLSALGGWPTPLTSPIPKGRVLFLCSASGSELQPFFTPSAQL